MVPLPPTDLEKVGGTLGLQVKKPGDLSLAIEVILLFNL